LHPSLLFFTSEICSLEVGIDFVVYEILGPYKDYLRDDWFTVMQKYLKLISIRINRLIWYRGREYAAETSKFIVGTMKREKLGFYDLPVAESSVINECAWLVGGFVFSIGDNYGFSLAKVDVKNPIENMLLHIYLQGIKSWGDAFSNDKSKVLID
jgi:hypothetical protein